MRICEFGCVHAFARMRVCLCVCVSVCMCVCVFQAATNNKHTTLTLLTHWAARCGACIP